MYKLKLIILFLFPSFLFSQLYKNKEKGEIFNSRPTKPLENINNTGAVTVSRNMYGLIFYDKNISEENKERIKKFFEQQNKGYTDFKTYNLKIRRKNNDWFIDNYKF